MHVQEPEIMNATHGKLTSPPRPVPTTVSGAGLVEVMIALFIFAFGALAIASMQATAIQATHYSSDHLALDSVSRGITEHLKANTSRASLGDYNTGFDELNVDASRPDAAIINGWKNRVSSLLHSGATQIQCTASNCMITIRWKEYTGNDSDEQLYNLNIPLYDS